MDGTGEWCDFYDEDTVCVLDTACFLNWQKTPSVQPDEPGTSCSKMFYYGLNDEKNGLGDFPCKAITGDECYYKVSFSRFDSFCYIWL